MNLDVGPCVILPGRHGRSCPYSHPDIRNALYGYSYRKTVLEEHTHGAGVSLDDWTDFSFWRNSRIHCWRFDLPTTMVFIVQTRLYLADWNKLFIRGSKYITEVSKLRESQPSMIEAGIGRGLSWFSHPLPRSARVSWLIREFGVWS